MITVNIQTVLSRRMQNPRHNEKRKKNIYPPWLRTPCAADRTEVQIVGSVDEIPQSL